MSAPKDYFSILGLQPSFDIDLADLEKRYFATQRAFHPDRLVGKSSHDRSLAINHSMTLNAAYETLKLPLKRAQYLLSLKGISTDKAKPSPELLMEIMELRESLADTNVFSGLAALETNNTQNRDKIIKQLSEAFQANNTEEALELVMRLSYITKLADEIKAKKKSIAA